MNTSRLEAKVTARNKVNALVQTLAPQLLAAVAPFVGTKVILASGGFAHKFEKAIAPHKEQRHDCRIWFSSGHGYSLTVGVSVNVPVEGQSGVFYAEETIYLGELKNGVLEKLSPAPSVRPVRTVSEILGLRAAVDSARDTMRAAEHKLAGFGEHDNF